jgi:uncharacterized metal-binding protein YceD (DUF177 family)
VKVHLKQIPPEGLHLEGEEDCLISDLESEGVRCVGQMEYKIDVGVSDGALWANGTLKQPVELTCVGCLEKFVYGINVPAFALHTELHGPETVDLAPFMREDILLNLPAHPRCDAQGNRDCKGTVKPRDTSEDRQRRAAKLEHDWAELNKLKLKK